MWPFGKVCRLSPKNWLERIKPLAQHQTQVAQSVATSTLAAWRGTNVVHASIQPPKLLRLYDQEGNPQCRSVREALTALGLDALILPCPKGGTRYRAEAKKRGGANRLPILVDPNTDQHFQGAPAIVDYLFQTYGRQRTPSAYRPGPLTATLGSLASVVGGKRGTRARAARHPAKHLELWSFESSPYSRLVRERLTELEIAYVLHNIGKEQFADLGPAAMRIKPGAYKPLAGGRREKLLATLGRVQVPYLEDPNTDTKLYESAAIIDYLERQYAVG